MTKPSLRQSLREVRKLHTLQDLLYTPTSLPAILGVCAVECDGILKWRDHDGYVYDRRQHLGTIRG